MRRTFCFLILLAALASCTRNPLKVDISDVNISLTVRHFDAELLQLDTARIDADLPALRKRYGDFFDLFTYRMIGIGGPEQPGFQTELKAFISDSMIRSVEKNVAVKIDTVALRKKMELAFRHYKYYFPEKQIPVIYTCISGFNQSVVVAENLIGVSLDKYLGSSSNFYDQLGLPVYKIKNMTEERMVPEMLYAWATSEWVKPDNSNTLLSNMIYGGKMMYFLDAMLPDAPDSLKIGYSEKQLKFCKKNETKMWTYLAEHKELFTTDRMNIKRFIDDGPYTAVFSEESPARTGVWLGWQIVRSYMKQNPETTLKMLMENHDYQKILNESGYQP